MLDLYWKDVIKTYQIFVSSENWNTILKTATDCFFLDISFEHSIRDFQQISLHFWLWRWQESSLRALHLCVFAVWQTIYAFLLFGRHNLKKYNFSFKCMFFAVYVRFLVYILQNDLKWLLYTTLFRFKNEKLGLIR